MQCTYKALIGMRVRGEDDIHARLVEQALHGPAPWCARLVLYQGTCMSMHQQPRRPAPVHRRKAPPQPRVLLRDWEWDSGPKQCKRSLKDVTDARVEGAPEVPNDRVCGTGLLASFVVPSL